MVAPACPAGAGPALTVETERGPYVPGDARLRIEKHDDGLYTGTACFGFMQSPDVIAALRASPFPELVEHCDTMVFYLARPFPTEQGGWLRRARRQAYVMLARLALTPIEYFAIPPHQTVSLAVEVEF